MSLARRIIMFPLTRLVIAVGMLLVVGFLLGVVFFVLLGLVPGLLLEQLINALSAVITLLLLGKLIERRSLAGIGLDLHGAGRELALGFVLGALLMSIVIGIMALAGWYHVTELAFIPSQILWALVLFLLVSVSEEVIFRGLLFRITEEGLGSWLALLISALFFGLVHLGNPNATLLAGIAIALEAGILLGAAYMFTRSLWLAIGIHWSWNFVQGPIFDAPVSGLSLPSLLRADITGPELWTGGAFGPEAGLVAIIISTSAGIVLLVLAVRRDHVVTPGWMRRLLGQQPASD